MKESNIYIFENELYFSTKEPVPIKLVIESLQGLNYILSNSKKTFQSILDAELEDVQIYIDELKSGSLREKILVELIFKDEQKLDEWLEKMNEKLKNNTPLKVLLGSVLGAILVILVYNSLSPSDQAGQRIGDNNVFITINGAIDTKSDDIIKSVGDSFKNTNKLKENIVKTVAPSRIDDKSNIIFNGKELLDSSTINKIPTSLNSAPLEREIDYDNVLIEIRSIDLDNKNKGWNGLIPQIGIKTRVKITFNDEIDARSLYGKLSFKANVEVLYKLSSDQVTYNAYEIYIKKIID